MGYRKIPNLYKDTTILLFKQCYALEKIHGSSANINYKDKNTTFFSGGAKHEDFCKLFNAGELRTKLEEKLGIEEATVYGEVYAGKMQGMSKTYGKDLKFVAFEVKIGESWLSVPNAHEFTDSLGLEFVHYKLINANLEEINAERDAPSVQAIRNGMGDGHMREGVVLRPIIECCGNGDRIIVKHKRDEFRETSTPREVDPEKLKVLEEADAIANEWVTFNRLMHVLDKMPANISVDQTGDVIKAMINDITIEANGEIVDSKDARKAIGKLTAFLFKKYIKDKLKESQDA